MRKLAIFAVLAVVLLPEWVGAQSFYAVRRERSLIATVGSGTAHYLGEMVNPGDIGKTRPNFLVGAEYFLYPRISVRTELLWFQTAGSDAKANDDRWERNLHFRSSNIELSFTGTLNLLPMPARYYQRPMFNIYGFAGIGFLYFNPKAEYQGEWIALQPLQTEGVKYSRIQPVIPIGGGIKYMPHPYFNIILEAGYRKTFTDYLDDVSSTRYPDPASLKSDLSRALSDRRAEIGTDPPNYLIGKRGNPANDDGYFIINAKLQYYLPYQVFRSNSRFGLKRNQNFRNRRPGRSY